MKTIEEKAKTLENKFRLGNFSDGYCKGVNFGYIKGATDQRKIDIEGRFGTLNHIQSVLKSIVNSAERLTSGNVAHNKASIKLLASGLLDYVMNKE